MSESKIDSSELAILLTRLGNRAVRKAQEENRRLGIPNVYSKNGQIYYQLPDGEVTSKRPAIMSSPKASEE
ncbi:MAG: hypothetical protein LAT75_13605 [Candidatus Cyclonatronum sp.]|uniref:hypothetical protein n=1 Tax=Cyclonatronum sp. TaxID=3024185 RepID=UPI0025C0805F|nr:hypothetical protein [Cyclonatronum sp.]MCC5934635.1 hypothetical protein [Balneolales bacterium]MCH8487897.1 hypothetical protein [Cyclonatronum sp.]